MRQPRVAFVAGAWTLHLDNLRAEVGEQMARPGTRENARQFENANAFQRFGHLFRFYMLSEFWFKAHRKSLRGFRGTFFFWYFIKFDGGE